MQDDASWSYDQAVQQNEAKLQRRLREVLSGYLPDAEVGNCVEAVLPLARDFAGIYATANERRRIRDKKH